MTSTRLSFDAASVPLCQGPQTLGPGAQGHKNWVLCLAWSPDAKLLVSGGMDGLLWLWNPETGEPLGCCKVRL